MQRLHPSTLLLLRRRLSQDCCLMNKEIDGREKTNKERFLFRCFYWKLSTLHWKFPVFIFSSSSSSAPPPFSFLMSPYSIVSWFSLKCVCVCECASFFFPVVCVSVAIKSKATKRHVSKDKRGNSNPLSFENQKIQRKIYTLSDEHRLHCAKTKEQSVRERTQNEI